MKRSLPAVTALLLCLGLAGCGGDNRQDLANGVAAQMDAAATDVGNITKGINDAVKKSTADNAPLDLTEAFKATDQLRATAKKAQEQKQRIDQAVRAPLTAEEKEELARNSGIKGKLNEAYISLVSGKKALNEALANAEKIDRPKVAELREKIREAEGGFESLARPGT